jgi:opacity protein-like surface antigen
VRLIILSLILAAVCCAQPYEVGGSIGYGWYHNGTIFGAGSSIDAGVRNRFAAGFVLCDDLYDHFSGEFRYLYQDGHPFLQGNGVKSDIQGQSHTFSYSLLFHPMIRERRLRPFVSAGVGAKGYIIAGPPPNPQAIPAVATLNTRDQWKLATVVGGGVKYRIQKNIIVRADFLDYITTFPRSQIVPASSNTARGLFQQFTPMFGMGYTF